jgi:arylsulfatase A-like enzyme
MNDRRDFLKLAGLCGVYGVLGHSLALAKTLKAKPNILWIVVEDMSCDFGYQGQKLVNTPNVDRLAEEGTVFSNAYVTAPVCSPSRSAMITGMYQTAVGSHNHRSSR